MFSRPQLARRRGRHARMAVADHGHVVDAVEIGARVRVVEVLAEAAHHLGRRRVVERLGLRDHRAAPREQRVVAPRSGTGEPEQRPGMRAEREPGVCQRRRREAREDAPSHGRAPTCTCRCGAGRRRRRRWPTSAPASTLARPRPRARGPPGARRAPSAASTSSRSPARSTRPASGARTSWPSGAKTSRPRCTVAGSAFERSRVACKRASPCAPIAPGGDLRRRAPTGERSTAASRRDARQRPGTGGNPRREPGASPRRRRA